MIEKLTGTISQLIGYELLEHEMDLEEDGITVQELLKLLESKSKQRVIRFLKKLWKLHKYIVIYQRKNY